MHSTLDKIDKLVAELTNQKDVNEVINIAVDQRKRLSERMKNFLEPGLRVLVDGNRSGTDSGTIVKVNKTRCQVRLDSDGRLWNIPISMIRIRKSEDQIRYYKTWKAI